MPFQKEITIAVIGSVCCCLWLFVDRKIYIRLGMSPLFGSLKQERYEDKINVFSIGISLYIIFFTGLIFVLFKIRGFIIEGFSFKVLGMATLIAAIFGNIVTRTILSIVIEDKSNGDSDFEL